MNKNYKKTNLSDTDYRIYKGIKIEYFYNGVKREYQTNFMNIGRYSTLKGIQDKIDKALKVNI